jgi:hypothetical protein
LSSPLSASENKQEVDLVLRQTGNVKRSPPLLPPVDRLEEALRELIDQVFDHRRQWVKRNAAPHQLAIEMALRSQITAVGWHLAEQLTFDELLRLVERVACVANDDSGESERRLIMVEKCFHEFRTRDGGVWLA